MRRRLAHGMCAICISRISRSAIWMVTSSITRSARTEPARESPESAAKTGESGTGTGRFTGTEMSKRCEQSIHVLNCTFAALRKAAGDSGREWGQPKGGRRGPRIALHFTDTPGHQRHDRVERKIISSQRACLDGSRIFHASTRKRSDRLGLVQRATCGQHGADALSHSP